MNEKVVSAVEFEKEVQYRSLVKHYASVVKAVASGMGGHGFEIIISDKKEVGVDPLKRTITVPDPEEASFSQLSLTRGIIDHELASIRYKLRPADSTHDPLYSFIKSSVESSRIDGSACDEYAGCKSNLQELYYTATGKLYSDYSTPDEIQDLQKLLLCIYAENIDTSHYFPASNMFSSVLESIENTKVRTPAEVDALTEHLHKQIKLKFEQSKVSKKDIEKYAKLAQGKGKDGDSLKDKLNSLLKDSKDSKGSKDKSKSGTKKPGKSGYPSWDYDDMYGGGGYSGYSGYSEYNKDLEIDKELHMSAVLKTFEANKKKMDKNEIAKDKVQEASNNYTKFDYEKYSGDFEDIDISTVIYKPATHKDVIITPSPMGNYPGMIKLMSDSKQHYGELYARMVRVYKQLLPAPKRMQPKGSLEGGRVYRAVVLDDQDVFIRKQRVNKFDVSFQLLIDLSGSMGGYKIQTAVKSAILFGQVLNALGIPFEITGFTGHGTAHVPGKYDTKNGYNRFCPIRHYIFKPFKERLSWQLFGRLEGLFTSDSTTHIAMAQNVDGEAVDWAAKRLMQQHTQKKMLIVFSDGEPACGDPISLLRHHLKETVKKWSKKISIVGVGIEHSDVKAFYPKNAVVNNVKDLADKMVKIIEDELKLELKHGN